MVGSERRWKKITANVCAVVTVPAPMIVRPSSVSLDVDFSLDGRWLWKRRPWKIVSGF